MNALIIIGGSLMVGLIWLYASEKQILENRISRPDRYPFPREYQEHNRVPRPTYNDRYYWDEDDWYQPYPVHREKLIENYYRFRSNTLIFMALIFLIIVFILVIRIM